jgi:hypothetical protein
MGTRFKCQVFNKQVSDRNSDQLSDFNVGISFGVINFFLLMWEWQYVMTLSYTWLGFRLELG